MFGQFFRNNGMNGNSQSQGGATMGQPSSSAQRLRAATGLPQKPAGGMSQQRPNPGPGVGGMFKGLMGNRFGNSQTPGQMPGRRMGWGGQQQPPGQMRPPMQWGNKSYGAGALNWTNPQTGETRNPTFPRAPAAADAIRQQWRQEGFQPPQQQNPWAAKIRPAPGYFGTPGPYRPQPGNQQQRPQWLDQAAGQRPYPLQPMQQQDPWGVIGGLMGGGMGQQPQAPRNEAGGFLPPGQATMQPQPQPQPQQQNLFNMFAQLMGGMGRY